MKVVEMIFIVVLSILVLISLVGNTLVILTILINKAMQTTLNYLLVNLAVADMISSLCIGIGYIMTPFIAYPERETGRYLCTFLIDGELAWVGAAESILCLVYIAVERYFAIVRPLRQHGRFTRRGLQGFIILGWSFAIFMKVPAFMERRYYHSDLGECKSLGGIVPVSIMVYLYSRLVHHLWFKPVQNLEASQRASLRYRKQVTITLITVSFIYAVCWIPILAGYLEESWSEVIPWFDKTGTALLTFNSSVNPVLYSMRMKNFRKHLRDMLLCKKRQRGRGQSADVCVGPTIRQPMNGSKECARNLAAATPFSMLPAFKQEVVTTGDSLDDTKYRRKSLKIPRATVDIGNVETANCTTVTEGERVKRDSGTDSLRSPEESMKTKECSIALEAIGTLKTLVSPETRNNNPQT